MIRIKQLRAKAAIILALPCFILSTSAQSLTLQKKVKNAFLQNLKTQQKELEKGKETFADNKGAWNYAASATVLQEAVDEKDIDCYQQMVWKAWQDANKELKEEKLIHLEDLQKGANSRWTLPNTLEPNATMPYYYGRKDGNAPKKFPLFLYLHGSGPKQQEWETGLKLAHLFKDAPSAYFIPQIPN